MQTNREALLGLAYRCETAEGPSYVLDCEIWDAIYPGERTARFAKLTAKGQPYYLRLGPADMDGYVPPLRSFTASIDAAMTLVPEGWGGAIHFSEDRPDCELHCTIRLGRSYPTNKEVYAERSGMNASISLALCAAALKARAQKEPDHG